MAIYKEKQNGFAPIVIVLLVVVGIGAIGGAVYFMKNKGAQDEKSRQEMSDSQERKGFQADNLSDNFSAGTTEDLAIGEKVVVRGAENQDGSISATMILIGALESSAERDFSNRPMLDRPISDRPMPEGFNPEEFRNFSPEERMERIREFRANAGGNFRVRDGGMVGSRMAGGAAFIRGEIIDKDEASITVKLVDGGSRLIFYSDDTEIRVQE